VIKMISILNYFIQSELALASYFSLSEGISGKLYTDALQDNGKGMSEAQANAFAERWSVMTQEGIEKRGQIYFSENKPVSFGLHIRIITGAIQGGECHAKEGENRCAKYATPRHTARTQSSGSFCA